MQRLGGTDGRLPRVHAELSCVSQPATVNGLIDTALDAGATPLKPATKQFWGGYSGVAQARTGPYGRSRRRRRRTPARPPGRSTGSRSCWESPTWPRANGSTLTAALPWRRAIGRKFVSFAAPSGAIELVLYRRDAAAKDAGVSPDGTGSHRLIIGSDAGPFTDPDGFAWEAASP